MRAVMVASLLKSIKGVVLQVQPGSSFHYHQLIQRFLYLVLNFVFPYTLIIILLTYISIYQSHRIDAPSTSELDQRLYALI